MTKQKVNLYADGSCLGNPGRGGYGTILECRGAVKELSMGFVKTTNNRMEIMGVIAGLEALTTDGCIVDVYTDSEYVCNSVNKGWASKWNCSPDFAGKKNRDLWRRILPLLEKHTVTCNWIMGHMGHVQNERCDALAKAAANNKELYIDKGYA